MIEGQRARNVPGSPPCDRAKRWGTSVMGLRPRVLRECCIGCRTLASGADRMSFSRWLERIQCPNLGLEDPRVERATAWTWPRAPPTLDKDVPIEGMFND